jgi:hypothetical protein
MEAIIKSIKTSSDGGYVISFDVSEDQREQVKLLLDMLNTNISIEIVKL